MKKNWLYAKYIFFHKLYVLLAGLELRVPIWRLLIHDFSKLSRVEWVAYREFFYGTRTAEVKHAFKVAWLHHIHCNPHHWNHWTFIDDDGVTVLEMPDTYVREMVSDWFGAGRAIWGKWQAPKWYAEHKDNIKLHPNTRELVEKYLKEVEF